MISRALRWLSLVTIGVALGCGESGGHGSQTASSTEDGPRIAALSPALGVMLIDLGLEDRVVARHAWDSFLPASIPHAGDQSAIDYERLIAADPTHVLLEWGSRELPTRLVELAADRGWTIADYRLLTLEDTVDAVRTLAAAFDIDTDLPERMASAWSRRPPREDVGDVLLMIQTAPEIAALGPGSAHAEILERLGFSHAFESGGPYQVLLAEDVAALEPAHVVVIAPNGDSDAIKAEVANGPIARVLPDASVHVLTGQADLTPGPRLVDFASRLEAALVARSNRPR